MSASQPTTSIMPSLDGRKHEQSQSALMCADEVASKLKVCKATVYKMVKTGQIEAVHMGRLVRITPESYAAFVAKHGA